MPAAPAPQARRGTAFHAWLEERFGAAKLVDLDELPGSGDEFAAPDGALAELQEAFLASEWADRQPVEVEVPFETPLGPLTLRGRIDAGLRRRRTAATRSSTGRPGRRRRAPSSTAAGVQLAAYRLGWSRLTGVPGRAGQRRVPPRRGEGDPAPGRPARRGRPARPGHRHGAVARCPTEPVLAGGDAQLLRPGGRRLRAAAARRTRGQARRPCRPALFADLVRGHRRRTGGRCRLRSRPDHRPPGGPRVVGERHRPLPAMVAVARRSHPSLRFDEGALTALDLAARETRGRRRLVLRDPHPDRRAAGGVRRVLPRPAPRRRTVAAPSRSGDEPLRLDAAYGHPVSLVTYRRRPEVVADLLRNAGFTVHTRLLREPERWETVPQAYLLARRSEDPGTG